jgi:basic membrane protein A
MNRKATLLLSLLLASSLLLAACAPAATATPTTAPTQPAAETPTSPAAETPTTAAETPTTAATSAGTPAANVKVCQVTDTGGIDDKSFNATAWKGVQDAIDKLGIQGKYLESKQETDYEKNINAFLDEKCSEIITVGFLLADATKAAAQANPNVDFAIVDNAYPQTISNIEALVFNTDDAGILAGYLAAGMTKTGKVGTFGGLQIPTVTIFMDGFSNGVAYYNQKHNTSVQVLGWDVSKQTGLFAGNFDSLDDGRRLAQTLMSEGADIIMPVAGPVGLGAAAAIKEAANGTLVIGVDTDWFVSAPDYADIELTSVMKKMDVAVYNSIESVINGTYKGGNVIGSLENGGVDIAPFHNLDSKVPTALKTELDQVRADIIAGKLPKSAARFQ